MVPTMIFTALLALAYVVLIVGQLRTLDDDGPAAGAKPPLAARLAARFGQMPEAVPADRHLARAESDAVDRLMRGELGRAGYQAALADLACRDAAQHPLDVPSAR